MQKFQKRKNLKIEDYYAIRENCKSCVGRRSAQHQRQSQSAGNHSATTPTSAAGAPNMPAISNLNIVLGRGFIPADDEYATRVVIVGYDIVDKLLPNVDPIGQEIRVDGEPYTVIGVGERQGETLGVSQDN